MLNRQNVCSLFIIAGLAATVGAALTLLVFFSIHHLDSRLLLLSSSVDLTTATPRPELEFDVKGGCGVATVPSSRIVGGSSSRLGQWPWMAAIFRDGGRFKCGGTLINSEYVLTAAHCIFHGDPETAYDASELSIRLGEVDLYSNLGQTFLVEEIHSHPSYDSEDNSYDIALLKLSRNVTFTHYIRPICLPSDELRSATFAGELATVTGWGSTEEDGETSDRLQRVRIPVWRNEACDREYPLYNITDIYICAGYYKGGNDSCQGDSGGPLMLQDNGRWMQIGIVSFSIGCARRTYPGVNTRVTEFLDWINENIRQ